jgi:hypothetical protein
MSPVLIVFLTLCNCSAVVHFKNGTAKTIAIGMAGIVTQYFGFYFTVCFYTFVAGWLAQSVQGLCYGLRS